VSSRARTIGSLNTYFIGIGAHELADVANCQPQRRTRWAWRWRRRCARGADRHWPASADDRGLNASEAQRVGARRRKGSAL
jgi:hypothetical protein